ncbi:glucan 1,4-alpha-glucosidase [Schizosaccharomyces cryophilus OY26]|uniref:Glucan 1,4-alpha-glucosidase n=1 Tax=Schizosaccharomyces cryophilus (strain OY26 / ATCC MYA-4695 / CBS 11777 / NBRC 106824 / NRRL Y48691) TaxID=653667 RepID=S9X370_SCHCR|nr:glucan 1,4-alpha-glucosidase [Schizosaccharomyces cryophilus OY26]EPY51552.1 glucan 1,4-alpha-glucosidase [Schizosaccharomyces cryophilus OY26]
MPPHSRLSYGADNYSPREIDNHGFVGNMHTSAMISVDGSVEMMCWPQFDSPSVFARILDARAGHFSITPVEESSCKQMYEPSTNVLHTKFYSERGVVRLLDFFHRQWEDYEPLYPWLIRRVCCIRGSTRIKMECFPAFNYAMENHETKIMRAPNYLQAEFYPASGSPHYILDAIPADGDISIPLEITRPSERLVDGGGITCYLELEEGQEITFVFRQNKLGPSVDYIATNLLDKLEDSTKRYWRAWIQQCTYTGRYREFVQRNALTLKLLIYEPTGAVVASPSFSLPEDLGGVRNWDYRFTWIRDSAFTIYALAQLGFRAEAVEYMSFIYHILKKKNTDGGINIVYSIRGDTEGLEEKELNHLRGYYDSRPVRIGNGAVNHLQLDIYGELMDAIYIYDKKCQPIAYDLWLEVRHICDYVCANWKRPDKSIWEVRGQNRNFLYSKIMLWVALDRALRIAFLRSLPCPKRIEWMDIRDEIYETIMQSGYNVDNGYFAQSFENIDILDAGVLVMPMVSFISPTDPRFLSTMDNIMKPLEKGGLMSNGLIFRYNNFAYEDGVGGDEGAFTMVCFWLVEALAMAGCRGYPKLISTAVSMFEDLARYSSHLSIYSEECSLSSESLGNCPQAFSSIAAIAAAHILDKALSVINDV